MQTLSIIRHGTFDPGVTKLNMQGKEQMGVLISTLKHLCPSVYSSVGPRSIESARILAQAFGSENISYQFLGSNDRKGEAKYYSEAYTFLEAQNGNVVVVTKGEWANDFIPYFYKKMFNKDIITTNLNRGEGLQVDCGSGEIIPLPK